MDSQARVGSLDVFQDVRTAYAKFGDAGRNALIAVDLEIRRMLDWLEKDQVAFWKGEIRRREEQLNEAKTALHRKRITATFGNVAADSEEILMVRRAQAKLEHAEAKLKEVKQWYFTVEQEVSEYRGPSQQLANVLDSGVPRALGALDRMVETLESYLAVATTGGPASGVASGTPLGSAPSPSAAKSASVAPSPAVIEEFAKPKPQDTEGTE